LEQHRFHPAGSSTGVYQAGSAVIRATAGGRVPPGTRGIVVTVILVRTDGAYNDA
jgi:hypothetical protein